MASGIVYATREQIMDSLEIMETARSARLVDSKLAAATPTIEGLLHRRFYPERRTISVDWPNYQLASAWEYWLGRNELVSLESVTSGGIVIPLNDIILLRGDDIKEPPYNRIQVKLSSSSAFSVGVTFQQSLVITGLFGYNDTDTSQVAGTLGGNINNVATTLVINPSSGIYSVGVGSIILIGTERMILTDRRMSDTAVITTGSLEDSKGDTILGVADGTQFAQYETILIDAERLRIDDIAGNNLIVTRAWDGSTLMTHNAGADVYALRTFSVKRGALGSTAASHLTTDPLYAHVFPPLVNELAIAETMVMLEQSASAYAREVGTGARKTSAPGVGLPDIRERACTIYSRNRSRAEAV